MKIKHVFSFPSKNTFTIGPIRKLVEKYVGNGKGWIDPFAGDFSPAEFTNDLNPDKNAKYHLHAMDFLDKFDCKFKGGLFDPPYSLSQLKECYQNIGVEYFLKKDCQTFPFDVRCKLADLIEVGGYLISCGWDSNGVGRKFGFEMIEILLVCHGGKHHDTIVTVERRNPLLFDITPSTKKNTLTI